MCLIVCAWQQSREFPLVLAANRDERHARAAAPMEWWSDEDSILAGRDLEAGGTWLALARSGRFAAVTNYREGRRAAALRSRGELVSGFAAGGQSASAYAQRIDADSYAGFTALLMDAEGLACVSNRDAAFRSLEPGVYGLSNAALDTPWPKLERAREALARTVRRSADLSLDELLTIVGDRAADSGGPAAAADVAASGASPLTLQRAMSAPFIVDPDYGTRCSTAILYRADGHVEVAERRFDAGGHATGESRFVFLVD